MPTFGYISADSGIFRILAQLDIFMYIKAYSEPIVSSGIFRNVDNIKSVLGRLFIYYSRAIYAYPEPYLGRFRYIQNFGLFRHVMFHAYSIFH